MVLANYITLMPGVPKRLHATGGHIERRERRDPKSGVVSPVSALVLDIDEEDGQKVSKQFSTLSEKLAVQIKPWIDDGSLSRRTLIITKAGADFATEYSLQGPLR